MAIEYSGSNSVTESALSQMAERVVDISDTERGYVAGLSDEQVAVYTSAELLNRALLTERIGGADMSASTRSYRSESGDLDAAELRAVQIERARQVVEGIDTNTINEASLPVAAAAEATRFGAVSTTQSELLTDPALLEGVIGLQQAHLQEADANERTWDFKTAQVLSAIRSAYSTVRSGFLGMIGRKTAEIAHTVSGGRIGRGTGLKVVTAGVTLAGTVGVGIATHNMPLVGGIGVGITTQRGTYRKMMTDELRRDGVNPLTLPFAVAGNWVRHTFAPDADRGEKTGALGVLGRALSFGHVSRQVMEARMVGPEEMYALGIEAQGGDKEALTSVERYVAVLQNRIDERVAAGERIPDNDAEYETLVAALQVLSMSTVSRTSAESAGNVTQRQAGLQQSFNRVGNQRKVALAVSTAAGVAAGALGKWFFGWRLHQEQMELGQQHAAAAEDARQATENARKAVAAKALADAEQARTNPEITAITPEKLAATTRVAFGINEHSQVDLGYAEHLTRLDMAKALGANVDGHGQLLEADIIRLHDQYGVVQDAHTWQLDFAHMNDAGRQLLTAHTTALESAAAHAATTAATNAAASAAEMAAVQSLSDLHTLHLDHESMVMLSRNLNMKIEQLRELRWDPHASQQVHELFKEQQTVIEHLLKNKSVTINGRVIDLQSVNVPAGASQLDRVRAALRMWSESKSGTAIAQAAPAGGSGVSRVVEQATASGSHARQAVTTTQSTPETTVVTPVATPVQPAVVTSVTRTTSAQPVPEVTTGTPEAVMSVPAVPAPVELVRSASGTTTVDTIPAARPTVDAVRQTIAEIGQNTGKTDVAVIGPATPPAAVDTIHAATGNAHEHIDQVTQAATTVVRKARTVEGPGLSSVDVSKLKPLQEAE